MARMISNTHKFVNRTLRAHVVGLTVQSVLNVGAIPGHKDKEGGKRRRIQPKCIVHCFGVSEMVRAGFTKEA